MGYTRQFTHSYTRNDIAQWRSHASLLMTELIAAGWKYTGDTGQIDFSTITAFGTNNTFAGYKIIEIDDAWAALGKRIILKLEFGWCHESMAANYRVNNTMAIRLSIGTGTDGVGNLTGIVWSNATTVYPSSQTGTNVGIPLSGNFFSYFSSNQDRGFYGVSYFNNGRTGAYAAGNGFNACTLSFFIQRSIVDGVVTGDGFTAYIVANTNTTWASSGSNASRWPGSGTVNPNRTRIVGFSYSEVTPQNTTYPISTPARDDFPSIGNRVVVGPTYGIYPYIHIIPNLVTIPTGQVAEGATFNVETSPGMATKFIMLGPGTGLCPDERGQYCSYAMLWE